MARKISWTGNKLNDVAIIVVDLGNNFLKVYAYIIEDGQLRKVELSIPHGYIPLTALEWQEAVTKSKLSNRRQRQSHTFQIVLGGTSKDPITQAVSIGRGAFTSGRNKPMLGSDKYVKGGIDALLCAVLSEIFPKDKYPKGHNNLIVGYGFPSTELAQHGLIESLLQKKHRLIDPDGNKRLFDVRATVAWEENIGGIVNAMSIYQSGRDPQGRYAVSPYQEGDRILLYDGGGWLGSMAYAEVGADGFVAVDFDSPVRAIDGGAITVRRDLRQSLKNSFPILRGMRDSDLTDLDLDIALKTGEYTVSGNNVLDVRGAIADSLSYVQTVKAIYTQDFAAGRTVKGIVMTGGTSDPLYDYLKDAFAHGNEPRLAGHRDRIYMANVRGGMGIVLDRLITDNLLPDVFKPMIG